MTDQNEKTIAIKDDTRVISTGPSPILNKDLLAGCIHCGLCLPACPTYLATGREMESPRGRIYLLGQWSSGKTELTERMASHIESCLGCLGCQTACPSGVKYEEILNQARPELVKQRNGLVRAIMRFSFEKVLPSYGLLRFFGSLLRLWQLIVGRSVLRSMIGKSENGTPLSLVPRLLERLASFETFVPEVPPQVSLPPRLVPKAVGENARHAQLFSGCIMDVFYNHVNHASMRLLLKQGHSVEVPKQTCCGALAYHAGELDIATKLAKENIELFGYTATPIVVTSAGCGAMLKHYAHLFEGDHTVAHRAQAFSARVSDITEFLADHVFPEKGRPLTETTTYHAACHLAHAQGVRAQPLALLESLNCDAENRLIPLPEQEHCCGSAGIYNLLNTELSLKVLDRKLDFIEQTGAKTVVTTNPGCLLQLQAGIKGRKLPVEVRHLVEVLDQAHSAESEPD